MIDSLAWRFRGGFYFQLLLALGLRFNDRNRLSNILRRRRLEGLVLCIDAPRLSKLFTFFIVDSRRDFFIGPRNLLDRAKFPAVLFAYSSFHNGSLAEGSIKRFLGFLLCRILDLRGHLWSRQLVCFKVSVELRQTLFHLLFLVSLQL